MMRAGEAIILGQTLLTLKTNNTWLQHTCDGEGWAGCAIGGGLLAMGYNKEINSQNTDLVPAVQGFWPWMTGGHLTGVTNLYGLVLEGRITIEQLAEKVDEWEPVAEPGVLPVAKAEVVSASVWEAAESLSRRALQQMDAVLTAIPF
jgi:hypothetical protein